MYNIGQYVIIKKRVIHETPLFIVHTIHILINRFNLAKSEW